VTQLSTGRRRASKGGKRRYEGLWRSDLVSEVLKMSTPAVCSAEALVTCFGRLCFAIIVEISQSLRGICTALVACSHR
jgi:hypothetical protein